MISGLAHAGGPGAPVAADACLEVFTTRPDTIFGATYMVIGPEHPLLQDLTASEQKSTVEEYVQKAAQKSELERTEVQKVKSGVDTGDLPSSCSELHAGLVAQTFCRAMYSI